MKQISLLRKLYDVIIQQLSYSFWAKKLYQDLSIRQRDIWALYLLSLSIITISEAPLREIARKKHK